VLVNALRIAGCTVGAIHPSRGARAAALSTSV
jgi:hypothetical protein